MWAPVHKSAGVLAATQANVWAPATCEKVTPPLTSVAETLPTGAPPAQTICPSSAITQR